MRLEPWVVFLALSHPTSFDLKTEGAVWEPLDRMAAASNQMKFSFQLSEYNSRSIHIICVDGGIHRGFYFKTEMAY